jgi:purine-nucleoside phosphorylase
MQGLWEQIEETRKWISERWPRVPQAGLVLGTGLGDLAAMIQPEAEFLYEDIPNFPRSTAPSHAGKLVCGTLFGVPVVAMEGRFHYYEGYSLRQVTFPVRLMKALGAQTLILTSAVGGMNPQFELGDVVIIEDHINLLPDNPLRGVNDDRLGPRFPDMSKPYSRKLIDQCRQIALTSGVRAHTGVLVAVAGPNLETRAEYRMLRMMGADVVGMSTVPEVIVANHAGIEVVAFSVVTDMCLPDALQPADIANIIRVAGEGGKKLVTIISSLFRSV